MRRWYCPGDWVGEQETAGISLLKAVVTACRFAAAFNFCTLSTQLFEYIYDQTALDSTREIVFYAKGLTQLASAQVWRS